jgi:hypothetical protein
MEDIMDKHAIKDIRDWAKLRRTSIEIAEVIFELANNDEMLAQKIWENGDDQVLAKAFANTEKNQLLWGGEVAERNCGA